MVRNIRSLKPKKKKKKKGKRFGFFNKTAQLQRVYGWQISI